MTKKAKTKEPTANEMALICQIVAHHKLIEDLVYRVKVLEAQHREQAGRTITVVKLPPVDDPPPRVVPLDPWKETPSPYCLTDTTICPPTIGGPAPVNAKLPRRRP